MDTGDIEGIMSGLVAGTVRSITFVTGETLRCVEADPDLFAMTLVMDGRQCSTGLYNRSEMKDRLLRAPITAVEEAPAAPADPLSLVRKLTDACIAAAAYLGKDRYDSPTELFDLQKQLATVIEAAAAMPMPPIVEPFVYIAGYLDGYLDNAYVTQAFATPAGDLHLVDSEGRVYCVTIDELSESAAEYALQFADTNVP